jgi:hypothetical protein
MIESRNPVWFWFPLIWSAINQSRTPFLKEREELASWHSCMGRLFTQPIISFLSIRLVGFSMYGLPEAGSILKIPLVLIRKYIFKIIVQLEFTL